MFYKLSFNTHTESYQYTSIKYIDFQHGRNLNHLKAKLRIFVPARPYLFAISLSSTWYAINSKYKIKGSK